MRELNDEELKQYQIMILDEVDRFCREHKINYFLDCGTLLGAIRHNGFIPWDDDIDICMLREDYEQFIDVFNSAHQGDYHAYSIRTDPGYHIPFCKISYQKSKLIEENLQTNDYDIGINIDLFPVDLIPEEFDDNNLRRRLHRLDQAMYGKSFRIQNLKNKPFRQRVLILAEKFIGIFISKHYLGKKQDDLAQQFSEVKTGYVSEINSGFWKRLMRIPIECYQPIDHIFEGKHYMIPSGYDKVLTEMFGNYMKLPPVEERIAFHGFKAWSE